MFLSAKSVIYRLQGQLVKIKTNNINQDFLLEAIIKYIVPSSESKVKDVKKSKLEDIVSNVKPGIKPLDLVFIEDLVKKVMPKSKGKKIKKSEIIDLSDVFRKQNNNENTEEEEIRYAVAFEREKETKEAGYTVSITYEETEVEERLSVKVTFEDKPLDKYSIKIKKDKETKTKDNYSIKLVYENNYEKERLSVSYKSTLGAYLNRRQDALHNFEDRVPGKHVDIFSASSMPGVLGFTYLGQDRMALRDDLIGMKREVDIHESIHTPDEYETRILTDWIMSKSKAKYIK
jgi:hypothetical protein|tara:strand:- start:1452 stop:2318 length:867 start_codon:yes stop_codon:yes gene_type:complete